MERAWNRASSASKWNAAGTFEEKDVGRWARDRLDALVRERGTFAVDVDVAGGRRRGEARVTRASKCEGEATIVVIRGKPKHGFDFEVELEWCATFESEDDEGEGTTTSVKGTVSVPEASRDGAASEECFFEVKVNDRKAEHRDKEEACVRALKARGEAFLVSVLKTLDAELRERAEG